MRKRSKYRPKGVRNDVMGWIMKGMQPLSAHTHITTVKLKNHAAMDELVQGRGNQLHCDTLIEALNMTEALATLRIGDEYASDIRQAQDAMFHMCERGLKLSRYLFTGPELQAINAAMEIHDAQLDACTVGEFERAIAIVNDNLINRRMRVIGATT